MPTRLVYDKSARTIRKMPRDVLVKHPKIVVNWHGWRIVRIWKVHRYPTLTACGFGPLEIVWPRRGYVLPDSAA